MGKMDKVLHFLDTSKGISDAAKEAMKNIENRFGVSFWDYMALNGKRSVEVQAKMDYSLFKETIYFRNT
ncbi:hypothetical protein [Paenibacillus sp. 481]|uniref:hypothetical protein n=1 Tax=Paenibacillus sp. 481 TaxID=2835869 RepID=UPI001E623202|nr:hypothetical protein [Paenibacillus sp. 481]UHA72052.1 hypothetical protein KIK04_15200 [Paenibacillus sp. 481]